MPSLTLGFPEDENTELSVQLQQAIPKSASAPTENSSTRKMSFQGHPTSTGNASSKSCTLSRLSDTTPTDINTPDSTTKAAFAPTSSATHDQLTSTKEASRVDEQRPDLPSSNLDNPLISDDVPLHKTANLERTCRPPQKERKSRFTELFDFDDPAHFAATTGLQPYSRERADQDTKE
ncbi:hypothetical protein FKW77_007841 [Venturia effusa]|uniref:Uncharacterized protein n=1 Tax=Venturia effusa TaxID=50376 RepID=A0A517LLV1_9PEZI|nr:hypothetical protein FKW77_007841 [Venturia effusa]